MKASPASRPVDSGVRISHVHLRVADLERALQFYCGVLGFELQQHFGTQAAFVSAGGYHHHIGLNTWESKGGTPPPHAPATRHHRTVSPGHSLSEPRRAGRCVATPHGGRD